MPIFIVIEYYFSFSISVNDNPVDLDITSIEIPKLIKDFAISIFCSNIPSSFPSSFPSSKAVSI